MYIRSTGLGRTLLQIRVADIELCQVVPATLKPFKENEKEPSRLLMTMEVMAPVHWVVRAFVEPADLRRMIAIVLTHPITLLHALRFLIFGGKSPSLEVKRKEQNQ